MNRLERNRLVTGFRAEFIRLLIVLNIGVIIFGKFKNPAKSFRILSSVKRKRKAVLGLPKISKFFASGNRYFFSDNFPGWPSKAFNGFFGEEILRTEGHNTERPHLQTIFFAITSRCRLKCQHCFEWDNLSASEHLSVEDLKVVLRKFMNFGIHHIQLSGGEPLERFDDLRVLLYFSRDGADMWLLTSGFGLSEERAFTLKKAGLTGANISLDHWDESEHNNFRNSEKSFSWVKEAVKNCNEAGLVTALSLCATREFLVSDNLMKYAEIAREWGVGFIRLLEPKESGKYKEKDITLSDDQIRMLDEFYLNLNDADRYPDYPIVTYPGYHQRRAGCFGAGNRYLYIDSLGEIHACPFCHGSVGNILTVRLEDSISKLKQTGCHMYNINTIY